MSTTSPQNDPAPVAEAAASTHDQILVVALRLFAEKGYDATSMREIAEELGLSKPALYYHFDSKEGIVRALLQAPVIGMEELLAWAHTQPRTAEVRREAVERWAAIVQRHGLALFRFLIANRAAIQSAHGDHKGMLPLLQELCTLLAPEDATVADQLRIRMALFSLNVAGAAGLDIDADEADILAAARQIAVELMPS